MKGAPPLLRGLGMPLDLELISFDCELSAELPSFDRALDD